MSNALGSLKKAGSWFTDSVLGMDPGTSGPSTGGVPVGTAPAPQPGTTMGEAAQPAPAPSPAAAPAPTPTVPEPTIMPSTQAPTVQNIINPPAPPPAFGSAPESSKPIPKGLTSTFLGESALPKRQRAAGAYGFDKQNTGTKTLIGG